MSALLTADQATMQLKVSARTVRRMCAAGILPYERQTGRRGGRSGGVYLIPQESLDLVKSKSTQQRANPSAKEPQPINIGTFLARGGTEAFRTALARRQLIEAARSYDGPHRTQYLKALAAQAGIHLSTLYRWMDLKGEVQDALERAARTIRPKFDERGMRRRTSIEPEAREFFQAMWLQLNKPPVTLVIEKYYKPKALEMGWKIPSRATFYRLVDQDLPEFEKQLGREGISKVRGSLVPKNTIAAPKLKNKVWLADSRQHDFWVKHPVTGEPIRPHLVAFIDAASRVVTGSAHTFAPNTDAVRRAFTQAVYAAPPLEMGLPEYVFTDNGSEFQNQVITSMFAELGVKQHDCEVGAGWAKGVIESFFKTVSLWFDRTFNSWTGHNPLTRPEDLDEQKMVANGLLLEWDEFQILWQEFLDWYHNEHRHSGDGMNGKTPMERYAELPSARIGVPSEKAMHLLFMKEVTRKVTDQGIKLHNKFMWHGDLYAYGNRINRPLVGEWVTVRFDPNDKSNAFVFYEGEFVCQVTDKPKPTLDPDNEENMAIAGRIHARGQVLLRDALERLQQRKASGDINPWIPSLEKVRQKPEEAKGKPARMVTKVDRVVKQIEDQQQKDVARRKRDDLVSAKLREIGRSRLA